MAQRVERYVPNVSEDTAVSVDGRSYGELLGEYFTVVAEIAQLLDEFGRPDPGADERYVRLREKKEALRAALTDGALDRETTDVSSVLEDALSER